jgi:hypothetical protein
MSLETYEPDDAPKMFHEGMGIALVRIRYYRRYPATRHSPEEPAFIEIEGAMILDKDGCTWVDAPDEILEKLNSDWSPEAVEAYTEFTSHPGVDEWQGGVHPDRWYDW